MKVFMKKDFKELGIAVKNGMPIEEAQKVLEAQREVKARGEEAFWLEINRDNGPQITTIQVSTITKDIIAEIKKPGETYEDVIVRLLQNDEESKKFFEEDD